MPNPIVQALVRRLDSLVDLRQTLQNHLNIAVNAGQTPEGADLLHSMGDKMERLEEEIKRQEEYIQRARGTGV